MPTPRKGESRSQFVARAIPVIMREGKTRKQAVGKAEGIYSAWLKKQRSR